MTETIQRTVHEEIEVGGHQLVDRVRALLHEGNVRQIKVVAADGDVTFEVPMTLGVIAGGAVALAAPWLAILAVIAALVKHVRIVVEREPAPEAPTVEAAPADA